MMSQRWGRDKNVLWHLENPMVWNNTTEIPEQKKTTSWTPNDQATDKTKSSPNQLKKINKLYVGSITESDARPTGVQIKREAKPSAVIGLITKHADCHITFICNAVCNAW